MIQYTATHNRKATNSLDAYFRLAISIIRHFFS